MSKNLAQIYSANPITTIGDTDLLYVDVTATTDAGINGANFKALFLQPANNLDDVASAATSRTNLSVPATSTYAGNPNGFVAGVLGDFVVDTTDTVLYVCTTAGDAASAVWTLTTSSGGSGPIVAGTGTDSAKGGDGSETASGNYSFAYGSLSTQATGLNSFAFGDGGAAATCESLGNYSFAFGSGNGGGIYANGLNCFSFGDGGLNTGDGVGSSASENYNFCFGSASTYGVNCIGNNSFAFGDGTNARVLCSGNFGFAFGDGVQSQNNYGFAFGKVTLSTGVLSFAYGDGSTNALSSTGLASFAFGTGTTGIIEATGDYSFAFGDNARATGLNSVAWGLSTISGGTYSFAFGNASSTGGSGRDYNFAFGNSNLAGFNASASYNFAFGNSNNCGNGGTGSSYNLAFGNGCQASGGSYCVAIGNAATVSNAGSWVINDGVTTAPGDTVVGQFVAGFAGGYALYGGSVNVETVGKGLAVAEGSNAKQGTVTLMSGVGVVSNTSVTANSRIFYCAQDANTIGFLTITARMAASGFTITSSSLTDSGVVAYEIFEPAA